MLMLTMSMLLLTGAVDAAADDVERYVDVDGVLLIVVMLMLTVSMSMLLLTGAVDADADDVDVAADWCC